MFALFPIIYYYFSPYLIIMGASEGVVAGSFITFSAMLIGSLFLGRFFVVGSARQAPLKNYVSKSITRISRVESAIGLNISCGFPGLPS